jgi:FemAB-related protein (PEP-CTERM system-associated)
MYAIKKYDKQFYKAVSDYLYKNTASTPFHTSEWADLLFNTYKHKNETLIASENEEICGIFPLSYIKNPILGGYLATGTFASHCEVLGNDNNIKIDLIQAGINKSNLLNAKYMEIKNTDELKIPLPNIYQKDEHYTLITNCEKAIEDFWKYFSSDLRNHIRTAEKKFEIEIGNKNIDEIYELISITMKRHGTPVHKKEFYSGILSTIPNSIVISAKLDGELAALYLLIGYNSTIHSLVSASNSEYWRYHVNELVTWECIKYSIDNNYKYFDLGRSDYKSGTFTFKKRFGAIAKQLFYNYYSKSENEIPHIDSNRSNYKFATKVWSKLPLKVTQKTGNYFIRYIS